MANETYRGWSLTFGWARRVDDGRDYYYYAYKENRRLNTEWQQGKGAKQWALAAIKALIDGVETVSQPTSSNQVGGEEEG